MRSRCRLFRSLFLLLSLHTNHLHPLSRVLFFRGHRVSGRALAYLLNACNALSFLIVSFQTTAKGAPTRFGRHNTSGERPTIARTPSLYAQVHSAQRRASVGASWPCGAHRGASSLGVLKRPSARRGPGIVSVDRNVRSKCRCSCVLQFTS